MPNPANTTKSGAVIDLVPVSIRGPASLVIDPVAFIKVRTLDALLGSGVVITVDSWNAGGGIDILTENVDWFVQATIALTATNIAAAIQAALQVHDGTWTCVATDDWMVLTLTGQYANVAGNTIESDGPDYFLLNYQREAELEDFTIFQVGDGYEAENDISMGGNDMLYLLVYGKFTATSATTMVRVRLQFNQEGVNDDFWDELGLDQQPAAGGVMVVENPIIEYQIPVVAGRTYRKTLALPVDIDRVRVSVGTTGLPDADDNVGVSALRLMRFGATPT
jgi:hypothetical protein